MRSPVAAAFGLILLVVGCGFFHVDAPTIQGTNWRAIQVVGLDPVSGSEPTLRFRPDGVSGSTGCNAYGSQDVRIVGLGMHIGEIASTLRGCADEPGRIEQAFLKALRAVERYEFRAGRLVLTGPGGELVFEQILAEPPMGEPARI